MPGLFQVTDKASGSSVDVYAVKPTVIGGESAAEFFIYDDTNEKFRWFPSTSFEGDGGLAPNIPITGISLEGIVGPINLYIGTDLEVTYLIEPDNATDALISVTVENENILEILNIDTTAKTISARGLRTGTTNLLVTTSSGAGFNFKVLVLNPIVYPTSVEIYPPTTTLELGTTDSVTALLQPNNVTSRNLVWEVDDHSIVQLTELIANIQYFRGINEGTTKIRARSSLDNNIFGEGTITVGGGGVVTVTDEESLVAALADPNTKTINIANNIDLSNHITVSHSMAIFGQGHTLTYDTSESKDGIIISADDVTIDDLNVRMTGNPPNWEGAYGIQVYDSQRVALEDISTWGEDGGILINGSSVTMHGTIDVTGNQFGGIELSTGTGLSNVSTLDITDATLVNGTESFEHPTIWSDPFNGIYGTVIGGGNLTTEIINDQQKWWVDADNSNDSFKEAGQNNLTNSIDGSITKTE